MINELLKVSIKEPGNVCGPDHVFRFRSYHQSWNGAFKASAFCTVQRTMLPAHVACIREGIPAYIKGTATPSPSMPIGSDTFAWKSMMRSPSGEMNASPSAVPVG